VAKKSVAKALNQKSPNSQNVFFLLQTGWFQLVRLFNDGFHTIQHHFTLSSAPIHCFFATFK